MAHQFKVGDRVRLNASAERLLPWCSRFFGKTLSVLAVDVSAQVEDSRDGWFAFEWLELAPAPALIDAAKTYRTRDGRAVRIYATDGGGKNPVHGAIERENGEWVMDSWTATGAWLEDEQDSDDLIEVKPEHTVWANVYPGDITSYPTKEDADSAACADRIACIRVTYRAGDGL